jgi:membrane-bound serine protease (ClpP class)
MRWVPACLILTLIVLTTLSAAPARAQEGFVLVVTVDDAITKSTFDAVVEAITIAEDDGARAIILRLNTPGGGVAETLDIIDAIAETDLPVLGFVYPSGGNAVSAGTMILMATDLAAMAPFSTIGSVQPVTIGPGGVEPVTENKTINFLVTKLEQNMLKHGRNESLATEFVVRNLNLGAEEALEAGAIELLADDLRDLLVEADGLTTVDKGITLDLAGAKIRYYEPSLALQILSIISNPLIAGLLLIIGIYAIIFGVSAPGHGAEVFGIIALVVALVGLGLDVDPLAIFLIILGVAFLVVEVFAPGFGAFGAAGIVAIVLGTIFLAPIRPPEFAVSPEYQVGILAALLVPTAVVGGFLLFAMYKILQVRRRKPVFGGTMIGETAETVDPLGPDEKGYVMYEGELWQAVAEESIAEKETVYIHARDGPILTVGTEPPAPPEEKPPLWRRLLLLGGDEE